MELSDRKKLVLKAIVDTYIEKCEPVGSKYLVDYHNIKLSPATIRNTMFELEQMGLLEQPYTSAGRIPSSLGYRVYVDNLMQSYRLTAGEIREINESLNNKVSRLDSIIEQAGKLMSALTSLMSVAMTPKALSVAIVKYEIVYLDRNNFLLIMITTANIVKTKHVFSNAEIMPVTLARLSEILNENLVNIDINSISLPLILAMEEKMDSCRFLITPVLKVIYEAVGEVNDSKIFIDGAANLMTMPEYHDIDKAKDLINLIENKNSLAEIFSSDAKTGGKLNIYIGEENSITESGDSSLIFKTFKSGEKVMGAIGVIGPKRMNYSKVIARLEYFAKNMEDLINGGDSPGLYRTINGNDTDFIQGGHKINTDNLLTREDKDNDGG